MAYCRTEWSVHLSDHRGLESRPRWSVFARFANNLPLSRNYLHIGRVSPGGWHVELELRAKPCAPGNASAVRFVMTSAISKSALVGFAMYSSTPAASLRWQLPGQDSQSE